MTEPQEEGRKRRLDRREDDMKLEKGKRYDVAALQFRGEWTEGDGSGHEGYDIWHYFDSDGTYRGPDPHGIEPVFEEDESTLPSNRLTCLYCHKEIAIPFFCSVRCRERYRRRLIAYAFNHAEYGQCWNVIVPETDQEEESEGVTF